MECRRGDPVMSGVSFGSKADILQRNRHVRFTPKSGHRVKQYWLKVRRCYRTVTRRLGHKLALRLPNPN